MFGKTVLVTGVNSGVGFIAARELAGISKVIKPDKMVPVRAETVASMIVQATKQERPAPDLLLDADMYVE
ncbi:MAG: hypothetical protein J2P55_11160 [Rhizobiales bacterium]|nr:hypothetical protein [Hyphomicrobiales bacterium]